MKKAVTIYAVAIMIFLISGMASANMTTGDWSVGNSWELNVYSEGAQLDQFQIWLVGGGLESPVLKDFSVAGWEEKWNNGEYAIYQGPSVASPLWFTMILPDAAGTMYLQSYNGPNLNAQDDNIISWTGPGYASFAYIEPAGSGPFGNVRLEVPAVPAPGAILLGSIGIGLVGWVRRKRAI